MDDHTEARLGVSTLGPARVFRPRALLTYERPPTQILVRGVWVLRPRVIISARLIQ